jgi:hypothetical protein
VQSCHCGDIVGVLWVWNQKEEIDQQCHNRLQVKDLWIINSWKLIGFFRAKERGCHEGSGRVESFIHSPCEQGLFWFFKKRSNFKSC